MMTDISFFLAATFLAGLLMSLVRLPALLGFLAAGFHEAPEPCATIHDVELNHILGSVQSKPCPLAARVAVDVRQRLLGDPVEGGCSGPGQWLTAVLDADGDLNAATL